MKSKKKIKKKYINLKSGSIRRSLGKILWGKKPSKVRPPEYYKNIDYDVDFLEEIHNIFILFFKNLIKAERNKSFNYKITDNNMDFILKMNKSEIETFPIVFAKNFKNNNVFELFMTEEDYNILLNYFDNKNISEINYLNNSEIYGTYVNQKKIKLPINCLIFILESIYRMKNRIRFINLINEQTRIHHNYNFEPEYILDSFNIPENLHTRKFIKF